MHPTLVMLFKRTVPGHIFRGKRRLVKQVTKPSMSTLIHNYKIEEANMDLLRNPYLTVEESHGHTKELGKKALNYAQLKNAEQKIKPHVRIVDRLSHLKVNDAWD